MLQFGSKHQLANTIIEQQVISAFVHIGKFKAQFVVGNRVWGYRNAGLTFAYGYIYYLAIFKCPVFIKCFNAVKIITC